MNDEKITLDLVIDVQKDFITGALANTQAQANVAQQQELLQKLQEAEEGMHINLLVITLHLLKSIQYQI